jgi:rSAM/selenodomain-associated transferase 1
MERPPVAVALMAKAPRAGAVKTRLCPPLTPREAAALARAFLRDAVAKVRRLHGIAPAIAYAPESAREELARLAPGFAPMPQRGADLGARMRSTLAALLAAGHRAAIVMGTDAPTLPAAVLGEAVTRVAAGDVDLVVGPAEDGGYYLIGARADHPTLFDDVAWSTGTVLATTLRRAAAAGLRAARLPAWFDVDTPDDLARLRAALAETPEAAPATSRFLRGSDACRRRTLASR